VEGTVEPGILGAAWSPDDSLLALVTGKSNQSLSSICSDESGAQSRRN
jgi:hypothetical protein